MFCVDQEGFRDRREVLCFCPSREASTPQSAFTDGAREIGRGLLSRFRCIGGLLLSLRRHPGFSVPRQSVCQDLSYFPEARCRGQSLPSSDYVGAA